MSNMLLQMSIYHRNIKIWLNFKQVIHNLCGCVCHSPPPCNTEGYYWWWFCLKHKKASKENRILSPEQVLCIKEDRTPQMWIPDHITFHYRLVISRQMIGDIFKLYLWMSVNAHKYIHSFSIILHPFGVTFPPGLGNNHRSFQRDEVGATLNGACDQLRVPPRVFVEEPLTGAFCGAGKIPLSVSDGSCEAASGKCDSQLWLLGLM